MCCGSVHRFTYVHLSFDLLCVCSIRVSTLCNVIAFSVRHDPERLSDAHMMQSNTSRGFGFIYFEGIHDARDARVRLKDSPIFTLQDAMNGKDIDGRKVRVDFSATSGPHDRTPGKYLGAPTRYGPCFTVPMLFKNKFLACHRLLTATGVRARVQDPPLHVRPISLTHALVRASPIQTEPREVQ